MIVDAPWYVLYMVIRREGICLYNTVLASARTQLPLGATRQQAVAKTPAKWSAYQILSVIVVFVFLVFKV
jgi:hypothetical protein